MDIAGIATATEAQPVHAGREGRRPPRAKPGVMMRGDMNRLAIGSSSAAGAAPARQLSIVTPTIAPVFAGTMVAGHRYFFSTASDALVIASTAVEITASASGAQKGLWIDGSLVMSPLAASHLSLRTPPTQRSSDWIDLSAR